MRVESRARYVEHGASRLLHHDLVVISESEDDSKILDLLGDPGSTFTGEVRLADGYGEHYLLIQPRRIMREGYEREIGEPKETHQTLVGLSKALEQPAAQSSECAPSLGGPMEKERAAE